MKALILHLSDIHIKSQKDKVFSRKGLISEALRVVPKGYDSCFITVSGDIAFSGKEDQYIDSLDIFDDIKKSIETDCGENFPVHFIFIPGNHDCDFSLNNSIRENMIPVIRNGAKVDSDVIEACVGVQSKFFSLLKEYFSDSISIDNKLYWEYKFNVNGEDILFRCINTAWVSELHEKAGMMHFPVEYIPDQNNHSDLVFSLFHHPYNWLTPDNGRVFRKRVEQVSDFILTGHEHDATHRIVKSNTEQHNSYIEGAALQESTDSTISGFNALLVDTLEYRYKIYNFKWFTNRYAPTPSEPKWEAYNPNKTRSENEFAIKDSYLDWLAELGLRVSHPSKGLLRLQDVFIYPDLANFSYNENSTKNIKGEDLINKIKEVKKLIITGADDCGKTVLAKQLFVDAFERGLVPVYFDGASGKPVTSDESFIDFLAVECEKSLTGIDANQYKQFPKNKHFIIIDNYHKIKFKRGKRSVKEVVEMLNNFSDHLVFFANDIALQAAELINDGLGFVTEGEEAFTHYKIMPFGHYRREKLVSKWFSFDDSLLDNETILYRKIDEVKRLLDTVIGNNYIPPYPVILLPLLQAQQFNDQVNTNASTYGYFYELLIKRSLIERNYGQINTDVKTGYLTFLAKHMFDLGVTSLTERQSRDFHNGYEDHFGITVSHNALISILFETSILDKVDDNISFKYSYIYYYFVASNLKDSIYVADTQTKINILASSLHEEQSANILLFLTHLTKDKFVIDRMVSIAKGVFSDIPKEKMLKDIKVLSDDKSSMITSFEDKDIKQSRDSINIQLDNMDYSESISDIYDNENELLEDCLVEDAVIEVDDEEFEDAISAEHELAVKQVSTAMKTLQILGQLLKNYVGTMDGVTKELLVEECVGIGLRTLGFMFNSLEENKEEFIEAMTQMFMAEEPGITFQDASKKAVQSVFGTLHFNSYVLIKRISTSIGSPALSRIYDKMLDANSSPSVRLIYTSLAFDHSASFPIKTMITSHDSLKSNILALEVLKSLTINQFYLFNVPYDIKQQACEQLGIKYRALIGADKNKKLLRK